MRRVGGEGVPAGLSRDKEPAFARWRRISPSGVHKYMTPYYEQDGITIYHGDCREVLWLDAADAMNAERCSGPSLMARNGVTDAVPTGDTPATGGSTGTVVIVTDPPYGTKKYSTDQTVLSGEILSSWLGRLRTVAVFGWPEDLISLCVSAGVSPNEWVTWWPTNGSMRGFNLHGLWRESESIAIFGEHRLEKITRPRSQFAQWVAREWYQSDKRSESRRLSDMPAEARCGDVWTDASPHLGFTADQRNHPNEKPIAVMQRLLVGIDCQVVCDPFMGSGTTLLAAKNLGLQAVGVEVVEHYCEVAARRLAQSVLPLVDAG